MKLVRFVLPPLLWMVVIFTFSSRGRLHVSDVLTVQFVFFKTLHIIEYGFLALLWYRSLRNTTKMTRKDILITAFMITILYAVTDEFHQTFVPTREGTPRDVGIDIIGALLTLGFLWKLLPHMPKQLKNLAKNWHIL